MKTIKVKLTFVENILGTCPNNTDTYMDFIGGKSPDAMTLKEEVEALGADVVAEKGMTVFPRDTDGTPIFWSYQIEGFFKGTCGFLAKVADKKSSKIKAYKKNIDGRIFVSGKIGEGNPTGRKIRIENCEYIGTLQRPLRAQTAQGERVTLACSEEIPAGAWCEFDVMCLNDSDIELVKEWLDFGRYNGIGQWRNSGMGRFVWEEVA